MKVDKMRSEKMNGSVIKLSVSLILFVSAFVLYSCDKVTVDVPVESIVLELDDIPVVGASASASAMSLKSADELNSFDVSRDIALNDLSLGSNITKYQSQIKDAKISTATIVITAPAGEGTVIKNFSLQVTGVSKVFTIDEYTLGTEHTADLKSFCEQTLLKLFSDGSIHIKASGETDVTAGEKLTVTITMGDVTIKAKALD